MTLTFTGVMEIYTDYATGKNLDLKREVDGLCLQFIILGGVVLMASYLQMSLFMLSGERVAMQLRQRYYRAVLGQEMAWFDENSAGELGTRLASDVALIQDGLSEKLGTMLQLVTTFIAGFSVALFKGWQLSLVLLAVLPPVIVVIFVTERMIAKSSIEGQHAYSLAGAVAIETLGAIRTVVAFGGQAFEEQRYEKQLKQALAGGHRRALITGVGVGTIVGLLFSSYSLGMWYGAKLIYDKGQTPADTIAVFFCMVVGATSIGHAAPGLAALARAKGAAASLFHVINRAAPGDELQASEFAVEGEIEFDGVSFSYPSRRSTPILQDISFKASKGFTLALVGPSGSGKSTVVSLIERFYSPSSGKVTLDGVDINNMPLRALRRQIGLVGQEPILFSMSILENVLLGLEEPLMYSEKEQLNKVKEACRLANIDTFIEGLPLKYATVVGGTMLSGGQKQRVAIARAIIGDPRILLLDEATSALDSSSEAKVQVALEQAAVGRTTIIIAHRLSTIRNADKILVFDAGKIAEGGTHDQLVALQGIYANLVQSQTLKAEPVEEEAELLRVNSVASAAPSRALTLREEIFEAGRPFLWVLNMSLEWWPLMILGLVGALLDGIVLPLYAFLIANVTDAFMLIAVPETRELGWSQAKFWSTMFLALAGLAFATINARIGAFERLGESLTFKLRMKCFRSLLQKEMEFHDDAENSAGVLGAKLATEAEMVQGLISKVLGPLLMSISIVVAGLSLAFSNGWELALVVMGCLPLVALANLFQVLILTRTQRTTKRKYDLTARQAQETISYIRTVKGLAKETYFFQDYKSKVLLAHASSKTDIAWSSIAFCISTALPFFTNALAFWYGTQLIIRGDYTFAKMFGVITAAMFTGIALSQTSPHLSTLAKSRVATKDILTLLDTQTPPSDVYYPALNGDISFSNVFFTYPSRPKVPILRGITFDLHPGQRIALVGGSGSGKSTILTLLQRFYAPQHGSITINDISIQQWPKLALRNQTAIVTQEPTLFDTTIAANIAYAHPDPQIEDIIAAAKQANIHHFISSLPDQYATRVGALGSHLSGGQKQRIAIARALFRKPTLLLLDEATSALDPQSERELNLPALTTIAVTHRLSAIQDYDCIHVVHHGRIVESGSHVSLMQLKGHYHALAQIQSLD
ncbi:hypothetical protein DSO57_1014757 [Entomophthora muscae]|uniref:Uncharacterized protein n=1 Tax=Entomophthora muscae TaxID=34485 RepID=A0ACC2TFU1_9FUNG|nr:hypothetical protein DSO57_1014757 [Entomophthora muscae]